mmetsp:Transcript_68153/g.205846  ORF Transcript_68153/g.205846 Transcript_68153/m.205846 type:complete len:858 (-) Transcript_68153:341-2914(-)
MVPGKQSALFFFGLCSQLGKPSAEPIRLLGTCPDNPESDLCDQQNNQNANQSNSNQTTNPPVNNNQPENQEASEGVRGAPSLMLRPLLLLLALASSRTSGSGGVATLILPLAGFAGLPQAVAAASTCGHVKTFYNDQACCGTPDKDVGSALVDMACPLSGVCSCQRMKTQLAGVPGAMFPANFCTHIMHLKPVGSRHAPICEATDAGSNSALLQDGQAGNQNYPHGKLKVLATVGEVNEQTGAMLTGVPDGNGAYLKDASTVRFVYQSESYGPLNRQETFPFFVNGAEHVGVTGSHIHFIDFDRAKLAEFMQDSAPASAHSMIKNSGEAVQKMFNLKRQLVGRRGDGSSAAPHDSNVNLAGEYIVVATPSKADWLMQSLCSANLAHKYQWGAGLGVEDDLFITNEEWISYKSDAVGIIGLPVHVLNLATSELHAVSSFGLGGHEKIVEINTGTTDFVGFVPSGYNGAFGGSFPQVVAHRNGNYTRTDGNPYVWPQNKVPTRLYLGKKNTDKDNNTNTTDFLARNGFEYGFMYGFATDCSPGTPGAEGRDAWHKNTATAGAMVQGAFYRLRWRNTPGVPRDFVHDYAWEFQDVPEGAPANWCWWNANKDSSGAKTEHVSPDPRGGRQALQGSTAGYFGIYNFSELTSLLASGDFPTSIPATYTCLQPESDIRSMIELGGAGMYADGQNATVMPDRGQNPGKATFEDIDGLEWIAAKDGEDFVVIHEDGGNDFGERKFLGKVGTPMKYYFVAMSGGNMNSRELARVSAVEGVLRNPSTHEFSGATDLSGLLAKNTDGSFKLSPGDGAGTKRSLDAQVPVNQKDIVVTLQAHSNWGGWTESFSPDAVGQILLYRPALPAN